MLNLCRSSSREAFCFHDRDLNNQYLDTIHVLQGKRQAFSFQFAEIAGFIKVWLLNLEIVKLSLILHWLVFKVMLIVSGGHFLDVERAQS